MDKTEIRVGAKRFFDNKAFPRGFSKSGNFTLTEDQILSTYGQTLHSLELGEMLATNVEEEHFLQVMANPDQAASKIERTWLKYVKLARGRKSFHTLNGRSKHSEAFAPDSSDADDMVEDF